MDRIRVNRYFNFVWPGPVKAGYYAGIVDLGGREEFRKDFRVTPAVLAENDFGFVVNIFNSVDIDSAAFNGSWDFVPSRMRSYSSVCICVRLS